VPIDKSYSSNKILVSPRKNIPEKDEFNIKIDNKANKIENTLKNSNMMKINPDEFMDKKKKIGK